MDMPRQSPRPVGASSTWYEDYRDPDDRRLRSDTGYAELQARPKRRRAAGGSASAALYAAAITAVAAVTLLAGAPRLLW